MRCELTRAGPGQPVAVYMTLGWGLAALGRLDEAVEAFRQQVTVTPGDPFPQGGSVGHSGSRGTGKRLSRSCKNLSGGGAMHTLVVCTLPTSAWD